MYIAKYNNKIGKYETLKADVFESCEKGYLVTIDGNTSTYNKDEVFKTKKIAKMYAKERMITKKLKNQRSKRGKCTCAICGSKIPVSEVTLDHIIPKSLFREKYNLKDIRNDDVVWEECWDIKNLQICCKDCNIEKSSNTDLNLELKARKLNYYKSKTASKIPSKHNKANKVGSFLGESIYNKNRYSSLKAYEIAIRDSRIIPVDVIL